jgi:soluble cytochrome b562
MARRKSHCKEKRNTGITMAAQETRPTTALVKVDQSKPSDLEQDAKRDAQLTAYRKEMVKKFAGLIDAVDQAETIASQGNVVARSYTADFINQSGKREKKKVEFTLSKDTPTALKHTAANMYGGIMRASEVLKGEADKILAKKVPTIHSDKLVTIWETPSDGLVEPTIDPES